MKKIVSLMTLVSTIALFSPLVAITPQEAQAEDPHYVAPGTITIDGNLAEWSNYNNLLSGEVADVIGTTYYWDLQADDWTTTNPGYETVTTNIDQMFDLITMKMVHDNDFMYMMNEKSGGLYTINVPFSFGPPQSTPVGEQAPEGSYEMPYSSNYPSPVGVNVDQVMMFDTDGDGDSDYYVVINFQWSEGDFWENMPTEPSPDVEPPFNVLGSLYQESDTNGGTFNGRGSETLIQDFNASDVSMMPEMMNIASPTSSETSKEEGKQSRSVIFDKMNINWNDSVKVSYATLHNSSVMLKAGQSINAGEEINFIDQSSAVDYTFDQGETTTPSIITGAGPGGGPHVRSFDNTGTVENEPNKLFAYAESYRGGVRVATGDIDSDGVDEIITGTGENGGPHLRVFEKDGTQRGIQFFPFAESFRGGMDVASGDFEGDGKEDIAVSQFSNGQAWVKVYRYNSDRTILFEKNIFGNAECGATIAMGDVDKDGRDELIVGAGDGKAHVRIFDYNEASLSGTLKPISFYNFDETIDHGVDVAAGDTDGDTKAEIAIVPLRQEVATVRVLKYNSAKTSIGEFNAYGTFATGANIDMLDVDEDGNADVITGAGPTGGPQVRGFEADGTVIDDINFFAYNKNFRGGVSIAAGNF